MAETNYTIRISAKTDQAQSDINKLQQQLVRLSGVQISDKLIRKLHSSFLLAGGSVDKLTKDIGTANRLLQSGFSTQQIEALRQKAIATGQLFDKLAAKAQIKATTPATTASGTATTVAQSIAPAAVTGVIAGGAGSAAAVAGNREINNLLKARKTLIDAIAPQLQAIINALQEYNRTVKNTNSSYLERLRASAKLRLAEINAEEAARNYQSSIKKSTEETKKLKKATDEVANSAQNGKSGFMGLGKQILLTVGAVYLLRLSYKFLASSYMLFLLSLKQQRKLLAVLKSTGYAAGLTAKQLSGFASDLQETLGINDETIKLKLITPLLTFRNISGTVFKEAIALAADMNLVMGSEGITQLGKALNDPIQGITALTRVGVSFTEQQKEQIITLTKNGQAMLAQKIILKLLKSLFGEAAEASATSTNKIKNSFSDLKEQIGQLVSVASNPGLSALSAIFSELSDGLAAINSQFSKTLLDKAAIKVNKLKLLVDTLTLALKTAEEKLGKKSIVYKAIDQTLTIRKNLLKEASDIFLAMVAKTTITIDRKPKKPIYKPEAAPIAKDLSYLKEIARIKDLIRTRNFTAEQKLLDDLRIKFDAETDLFIKHGLNITDLSEKYLEDKAKIRTRYNKLLLTDMEAQYLLLRVAQGEVEGYLMTSKLKQLDDLLQWYLKTKAIYVALGQDLAPLIEAVDKAMSAVLGKDKLQLTTTLMQDMATSISQSVGTMASSFGTAFAQMAFDGGNFGKSMKNMLKQLSIDITASIIKLLVLKSIMAALGFINPAAGAFFGKAVGIVTGGKSVGTNSYGMNNISGNTGTFNSLSYKLDNIVLAINNFTPVQTQVIDLPTLGRTNKIAAMQLNTVGL